MSDLAPIYLFADSQPLFKNKDDQPFIATAIKEHIIKKDPHKTTPLKAAYIGASNGDKPEFYDMFTVAMNIANVVSNNCRMISARFTKEDRTFLSDADIILLAGGAVEFGWKAFQAFGLESAIRERYLEGGVILIGISAGAVQLGRRAFSDESSAAQQHNDDDDTDKSSNRRTVFSPFQMVPFCIGAHEEAEDWADLKELITHQNGCRRGVGIPFGGALICYPDRSFEAVFEPVQELISRGEEKGLKESLIMPDIRVHCYSM